MSWWKSRKCKLCRKKMPKSYDAAKMEINSDEGPFTIEICDECEEFWDLSEEILNRDLDDDEEDSF